MGSVLSCTPYVCVLFFFQLRKKNVFIWEAHINTRTHMGSVLSCTPYVASLSHTRIHMVYMITRFPYKHTNKYGKRVIAFHMCSCVYMGHEHIWEACYHVHHMYMFKIHGGTMCTMTHSHVCHDIWEACYHVHHMYACYHVHHSHINTQTHVITRFPYGVCV